MYVLLEKLWKTLFSGLALTKRDFVVLLLSSMVCLAFWGIIQDLEEGQQELIVSTERLKEDFGSISLYIEEVKQAELEAVYDHGYRTAIRLISEGVFTPEEIKLDLISNPLAKRSLEQICDNEDLYARFKLEFEELASNIKMALA